MDLKVPMMIPVTVMYVLYKAYQLYSQYQDVKILIYRMLPFQIFYVFTNLFLCPWVVKDRVQHLEA